MEFNYNTKELINIEPITPTNYLSHNIKGSIQHRTYLEYLKLAYANHYGIEVKPDYLWFTILNEISRAVKEYPEDFRKIFTDSAEKKEISIATTDSIVMPVEHLLAQVFTLIPSALKKDDIVLNFSTITPASRMAFSAAFVDAASPYYSYLMYLCGFNKIKVLGTVEDYSLIKTGLIKLSSIFYNTILLDYFTRLEVLFTNLISRFDDKDAWLDIFFIENCGSGHQQVIKGWFADLFYEMKGVKEIKTFPKHISKINYKNLSTGKSYEMEVGVFSSNISEDGYLVPDFEYGVNEVD